MSTQQTEQITLCFAATYTVGFIFDSKQCIQRSIRLLWRLSHNLSQLNPHLTTQYRLIRRALSPLGEVFKRELKRRHDVDIDGVFTITNMPISRFLEFLLESGNYERYMRRLIAGFNPTAARGVMCRSMISVGRRYSGTPKRSIPPATGMASNIETGNP